MPIVFSQGQTAPTQTQRPQSLPLRRSAVNSFSRRSKETLKLKALISGKSSSSSSLSKGGGESTSSAKSKKGEGGAAPSATDFVRVMRTLLFLNRTGSKSKASFNEKETIKPRRPSLDVSGHSFSKALKAELLRAKEAQGHTDLAALSRDSSPFQAALQKQHLAQLRSPTKGGFSSYKDWAEDDSKSDTMSRASSTSTLPASPPPSTRSALPPRCPPKGAAGGGPKGGGGFPPKAGGAGARRVRQPRAARAGFTVARPVAEGVVA